MLKNKDGKILFMVLFLKRVLLW